MWIRVRVRVWIRVRIRVWIRVRVRVGVREGEGEVRVLVGLRRFEL